MNNLDRSISTKEYWIKIHKIEGYSKVQKPRSFLLTGLFERLNKKIKNTLP